MARFNRHWKPAEKMILLALLLVGFMARVMWRRSSRTVLIPLPGSSGHEGISFSPDGRRLAIRRETSHPAIYDVESGAKLRQMAGMPPLPPTLAAPGWSPDGTRIVAVSNRSKAGKVLCWDSQSGRIVWEQPYPSLGDEPNAVVRFSSDGQLLLGNTFPPTLFAVSTGKWLKTLASSDSSGEHTALSDDGKFVAFVRDDWPHGQVRVTESATNQVLWKHSADLPSDAHWSKTGVLSVSYYPARTQQKLLLWDGNSRQPLPLPPSDVSETAVSDVAPRLAYDNVVLSSSKVLSSTLIIWNYRTQKVEKKIPLQDTVYSIQWSPNGQRLAVSVARGRPDVPPSPAHLIIFDDQGKVHFEVDQKDQRDVIWAPDSRHLAIPNSEGVEILRVD